MSLTKKIRSNVSEIAMRAFCVARAKTVDVWLALCFILFPLSSLALDKELQDEWAGNGSLWGAGFRGRSTLGVCGSMRDAVVELASLSVSVQGRKSKEAVLWQIHPTVVRKESELSEISQLRMSDIEAICGDVTYMALTIDSPGERVDSDHSVVWFGWTNGDKDAGIFSERDDVEIVSLGGRVFVFIMESQRIALNLHVYQIDLSLDKGKLRDIHQLPWQSWRPMPTTQYSTSLHEHGPCLFDELSVMSMGDSFLIYTRASASSCQNEQFLMLTDMKEEGWMWEPVNILRDQAVKE